MAAAPANAPVNGTVVQGSAAATATGIGTFGAAGVATTTIAVSSTANVINWGNPNTAATLNPNSTLAGFNIGTGSTVDFTTAVAGGAVVLNVDNSGQISTLDGSLTGTGVNVFVANANGIVVGSGAVLTAPVLGLIASDVNSSALTQTTATPTIALSFATAGSISVANGANINGGGVNSVLIAGAGTVNIAGTSSGLISPNLVIDGGVSGLYDSSVPSFTATSSVGNVNLTTAATNVNLNLGTAGGVFTLSSVYADGNITNNGSVDLAASPEFTGTLTNNGIINQAGTNVLTIGNAGASILSTNGAISGATAAIYANSTIASNFGSVVNNGTIAAADGFNLGIAGTFTNNTGGQLNVTGAATMTDSGFSNAGLVSVASLSATTVGDFSNANGSFTNSGTISINGSFAVNNVAVPVGNFSNSGTITVADNSTAVTPISNNIKAGGTVSNSGSMTFGNGSMSATTANLVVGDANFSNTGTLSLITSSTGTSNFTVGSGVSGTLAGSFSAMNLSNMGFTAGTVAGDIAQINTNGISASNSVTLSGYNVALNSSVSGASLAFVVVGGQPAPQMGTLSISSGATLGSSTLVDIDAYSSGFANIALAGNINGGSGTVSLGDLATSTEGLNALNNVQGAGSISSATVNITANGNVNNPNGGGAPSNGYLKNGLLINPVGGSSTVTVDATGPIAQYWNLKVLGNANYQSETNNFGVSGLNNGANNPSNNVFYTPAANAGSHLIMTAQGGNLTINGLGSTGLGTSNGFLFPGLVVAVSSGDMTIVGNLNNGFSGNAPAGNGILLNSGGALAINGNIYTNGGSLVNYWAPSGVTMNGLLYNVYQPTNTSTGVTSFANTPYLYGNFPGATPSVAGGARKINLYSFVK
ncbi:beta strand repeat-containing protein [Acidithiobacillus ferriphilus]|uniref:beta strand repeat-containing protein n=1 Tax=Acidithiobacillus ferriphilus TaxID=1689834 RepID=UPI003F515A83